MDPWVVKVLINATSEGLCGGDDRAAVRVLRAELGKAAEAAKDRPFAERLTKAISAAETALDEHLEIGERIRQRRADGGGIAFIGHMTPCSLCGRDILSPVDSDPSGATCADKAACAARQRRGR